MTRKRLNQDYSSISEEPTINLTPLIDIVFVILIGFILVAPLLELDRIELADASNKTVDDSVMIKEQSLITIHVHRDNTILFNKQAITMEQLTIALRDAKIQYPLARPQVFHDRQAHFGTYQAIKNAIESAGFDTMDIILKPA